MASTIEELENAFIKADEAGDTEDAKFFAAAIDQARAAQQPLTKTEKAMDVLKAIGSGTYKGLSYIPGIPGDIAALGEYLPEYGGIREFMTKPIIPGAEPTQLFPTSEQIRAGAEYVVPPLKGAAEYEPETTLGGYLKTIPEFAAPGIAAKTQAARKLGLGMGGAGGTVYETVENLTDSPTVGSGLSLFTMFAIGTVFGPSKAAELAQKALKGLDESEIDAAIRMEQVAKSEGIKLLPGETIDSKLVRNLTEDVYKSPEGAPYIYYSVKGRPKAALDFANRQAAKIADIPESQRNVLKSIEKTAKTSIQNAKRARTIRAQNTGYKVANEEALSPDSVLKVINKIDDLIKKSPPNSQNQRKLKQIRRELVQKEQKFSGTIEDVAGRKFIEQQKIIRPVTNINKLDSTFKTYRDAVKDSRADIATDRRFIDKDLRNKLFNREKTGVLDDLDEALKTNPNYKAANQVYEELTEKLVDVTARSAGPLAREGLDISVIENFVLNPKAANANDINQTLSIINKTDPSATKEIANLYFRNAIDNAFPLVKEGEDLKQGFSLIKKIAGTGNKRKNFMALLDNVADAHGVDRAQFKVGFEKMINVLERTNRIANLNKPGTSFSKEVLKTVAKDLAMAKTFNPLVRLSTKMAEIKAGGAMRNLGQIMASDESVKTLVELAKTDPQSKIAIRRVLYIINSIYRPETAPSVEQLEQTQIPIQ